MISDSQGMNTFGIKDNTIIIPRNNSKYQETHIENTIRSKSYKYMTLKANKLCIKFKLFGREKIPNLKSEQTHWSMDTKNSIFLKKKTSPLILPQILFL